MSTESIQLSFIQGSSDKVYHVALVPKDDGYLVNFAYGRRGGPLKTGTKTAKLLPYDQAKYTYDKLVKEKMAKGYTPDGSGIPFTASQMAPDRTNYLPQLLNPIEPDNLPEAFTRAGGSLALQTKHDGERRIVIATPEDIYGSNRKGLRVELSPSLHASLHTLLQVLSVERLVLDTEDMGDHLVVFDILEFGNTNLVNQAFCDRMNLFELDEFLAYDNTHLYVDKPTYCFTLPAVQDFMEAAERTGQEGIVIRDPRAAYTPGRPNSWGPCLKVKFYATATCIVDSIHPTKRSIGLALTEPVKPRGYETALQTIFVGNCTIPPNYDIPSIGDLVEIKYLYAYKGGSLYQPQYKGVRTDLEDTSASLNQLKFKE